MAALNWQSRVGLLPHVDATDNRLASNAWANAGKSISGALDIASNYLYDKGQEELRQRVAAMPQEEVLARMEAGNLIDPQEMGNIKPKVRSQYRLDTPEAYLKWQHQQEQTAAARTARQVQQDVHARNQLGWNKEDALFAFNRGKQAFDRQYQDAIALGNPQQLEQVRGAYNDWVQQQLADNPYLARQAPFGAKAGWDSLTQNQTAQNAWNNAQQDLRIKTRVQQLAHVLKDAAPGSDAYNTLVQQVLASQSPQETAETMAALQILQDSGLEKFSVPALLGKRDALEGAGSGGVDSAPDQSAYPGWNPVNNGGLAGLVDTPSAINQTAQGTAAGTGAPPIPPGRASWDTPQGTPSLPGAYGSQQAWEASRGIVQEGLARKAEADAVTQRLAEQASKPIRTGPLLTQDTYLGLDRDGNNLPQAVVNRVAAMRQASVQQAGQTMPPVQAAQLGVAPDIVAKHQGKAAMLDMAAFNRGVRVKEAKNMVHGQIPLSYPLSEMTLSTVVDEVQPAVIRETRTNPKYNIRDKNGNRVGTSAVGKGQFLRATLLDLAPKVLGPDWRNRVFTDEVQEALLQARYQQAVERKEVPSVVWEGLKKFKGKQGYEWVSQKGGFANVPYEQARPLILKTESALDTNAEPKQKPAPAVDAAAVLPEKLTAFHETANALYAGGIPVRLQQYMELGNSRATTHQILTELTKNNQSIKIDKDSVSNTLPIRPDEFTELANGIKHQLHEQGIAASDAQIAQVMLDSARKPQGIFGSSGRLEVDPKVVISTIKELNALAPDPQNNIRLVVATDYAKMQEGLARYQLLEREIAVLDARKEQGFAGNAGTQRQYQKKLAEKQELARLLSDAMDEFGKRWQDLAGSK